MQYKISQELDAGKKYYINNKLYEYNLKHFPNDLRGKYQEINLFLTDEEGQICERHSGRNLLELVRDTYTYD